MGKQEFWAVQCCECSAFQVQLAKKTPKFSCSVCQFKQSVQRIFAKSNVAKDVREVVQSYNQARSHVEEGAAAPDWHGAEEWQEERDDWGEVAQHGRGGGESGNKWAEFAEEDEVKWTVALPEPAAAGKVKGGGGGGSKRKREQQQQEDLRRGDVPAATSRQASGYQQQQESLPYHAQAWQQQQQAGPRQVLAHVNQGTLSQHQASLQGGQVAGAGKQWGPGPADRGAVLAPGQGAPVQQLPGVGGGGKWASFLSEDD